MEAGAPLPPWRQWVAEHKIATSMISGAIAGGCAKTATAPLDRIKLLFQIGDLPLTPRNFFQQWVLLYREEGFFRLWRGNSATLARIMPYAAIQFTAHEQAKRFLRDHTGRHDLAPLPRFAAGSFAGACAVSCTYPLDLMRAKLAVQTATKLRYRGLTHAMVSTMREEGVLALFRGLSPTLLGIVPYAGTSFFTYETIKLILRRRENNNDHDLSHWQRLGAGAVAGLVGQSVTYPFDVVRRRMQTDGMRSQATRLTAMQTLRHVVKTQGVRGLFRGLALNWIKGPIAVSISFTTFDTLKHALGFAGHGPNVVG